MKHSYYYTSRTGKVLPKQLQLVWRTAMVVFAAFLFMGIRAQAQCTTTPGTIEIDGNPCDWASVYSSGSVSVKSLVKDNNDTNDSQFTQGSQDRDLISQWRWNLGNTNDKGDITNTGTALIGCKLYFFGDRTAVNGVAQIGFWFFKDEVAPIGSGATASTFSGQHQVGDLLILSHFTNGGGTSQITVYEWVGSGGSHGELNLLTTSTASAMVNTTTYDVPSGVTFDGATWSYTPKAGAAGTYPTGSFFEGVVDLCDLFGSVPCFSSFLMETRNAPALNSLQASLQDLAAGNFDVTPTIFALSGSEFCDNVATTGSITLAGSQTNVSYQLFNSANQAVQAAKSGTGNALVWTGVAPGNGYYVVATRVGTNCTTTTGTANVVSFQAVVVDAGANQTVCADAPAVTLAGSISGGITTGEWIGGTGTFNPNRQALNAVYTPSAAEIAAGSVTLTLQSGDPAGPCEAASDEMTITINPIATVDAGGPYTVTCAQPRNVQLNGSFGGAATSGTWSGGGGTFSPNANTANAVYTPSAAELLAGTPITLTFTTNDPAGPCEAVSANATVNFDVCVEFQGCTLGYWKNHPGSWCSTYSPGDRYGDVFTSAPNNIANMTLMDALGTTGGGIFNLARQSVAALLNACHENVNYELTESQIIAGVNAAFTSGNAGTYATYLDGLNNTGCSIDAHNNPISVSSSSPMQGIEKAGELRAYPTPFSDKATIEFTSSVNENYSVRLYDVKGALIKELKSGSAKAGVVIQIEVDGRNLPEGLYLARMVSDSGARTVKLLLKR